MRSVVITLFMAVIVLAAGRYAGGQERGYTLAEYPWGDIFFRAYNAQLDSEARAKLDALYGWLEKNPASMLLLAGYDEQRTPRERSIELGLERAEAVRDYLVSKGADPARIKTISFGNTRVEYPGAGEEVWAKNRRVRYRVAPVEDPAKMEGMPSGVCQKCKM